MYHESTGFRDTNSNIICLLICLKICPFILIDAEDFEPPPPGPAVKTDRWEGEDEDDNVKDNWDDDDEAQDASSKSEGKSSTSKPLQPKKKTPRQIREEKKRLEEEAREAARRALQPKTPEELLAEKLEKQKILESSDLKLAEEIFAGAGQITVSFDTVNLETIHEFESFRQGLVKKLHDVSSSAHYALFVEDLLRDLCAPLDADDLKKIQTTVNILYNEKNKKKVCLSCCIT